jgi:mono/diheme cytochrome c family protein
VVASDAVLLAISGGQKAGLAVVAGCFIVFALLSSFVIPRYRPDYPGARGMRWFIVAALLFAAGTLSAVIFLANESKGQPEAVKSESTSGTTAPAPSGNPTAGKAVFASAGCSACHTFAPAGSTAKVGPDLDKLAADAKKANRGSLPSYVTESIEDPNAYVVPGYSQGIMPSNFGQSLTKTQIADLVAFLTQKG